MRYSRLSRFTDLSPLRMLDWAYLVVLLPLVLVIKLPMLLYMLLILILLLSGKKMSPVTLVLTALIGLFALYLSLYGAFSFRGLSRLSLFVELLTYLLILAVTLQRLTRQINFYLIISPILLMALSLFFFHSITMLFYVVFEIFMLLWLILAWRMQGSFRESLRMAALYFASAIPWVILLFIFFPRISFEHASYGFRGDEGRRMGHDGTMYLDNKALLVPSNRIVMEVGFEGRVPHSDQLYFRGSVLYDDKKDHWEPLPPKKYEGEKPEYESVDDFIVYKVTLYPTQKHWLYLLDLPFEAPEGARIDADFVTTLKKKIKEPQHYEATSALRYRYGKKVPPEIMKAAGYFDPLRNPKSLAIAKMIEKRHPDIHERLRAIEALFSEQNLSYSLHPEALDMNHTTDSFLFDKRVGYCVHFAASFVTLARMAGIPARIVTGYKGDLANSVENYLLIKERDAHAWAEVLIDSVWIRIETTAFAREIAEDTRELLLRSDTGSREHSLLKQADLYLMYVKYQIETWILHYSHFRQMQLLDEAKKSPLFLLKFLLVILSVVAVSIGTILYLRRPVCIDRVLCIMQPLVDGLQKKGCIRLDGETMHTFLSRCQAKFPTSAGIETIDRTYERIRYGGDDSVEMRGVLEQAIRKFLKEL